MRRIALIMSALIAFVSNTVAVLAQNDPRLPTDPSDPLKVLVDKLNDPERGAKLRAQWNIDRAVWIEPVTAVKNGVTVLVAPAHADIHTSNRSNRAHEEDTCGEGRTPTWTPEFPH
jgi:hypothetical protein